MGTDCREYILCRDPGIPQKSFSEKGVSMYCLSVRYGGFPALPIGKGQKERFADVVQKSCNRDGLGKSGPQRENPPGDVACEQRNIDSVQEGGLFSFRIFPERKGDLGSFFHLPAQSVPESYQCADPLFTDCPVSDVGVHHFHLVSRDLGRKRIQE